ncbi:hypothetical protein ANN_01498 [Periplaneta americana]|uniref:Transposase n=1 Tax=Periplaneta americana TaxID=6978 RepID=A0ABQ8TW54_PERAM|nr:hypothetical protein ANN_01498 [Periplaneta americana]
MPIRASVRSRVQESLSTLQRKGKRHTRETDFWLTFHVALCELLWWIGRGGRIAWLARSPDFVPNFFSLWVRIKDMVYQVRPTKELLLVDIMPHGTNINSDGYVATLKKLQVRLSRVRRHREKQDVLLLHDNAQPYVSHKTTDEIIKFG